MQIKVVQTGYIIGISLILTGIIYSVAANWQIFDRTIKISLILGLLLLFYLLHFVLRKTFIYHYYLSNWALIAASITFGITVALIGQVYNAHADDYLLFLIWFIPVLLFAILTKYMPFYILSFILIHLTIYMFMSPSSFFPDWSPMELLLMNSIILVLNASLFLLCFFQKLPSKSILYLSYCLFFSTFYSMTITEYLPFYYLLNFTFIGILIYGIYHWIKIKQHRPLLSITSIFGAIYLLYKVFNWVFSHYGSFVLYLLLLISVLLVGISVIVIGLLNKRKTNTFIIHLFTVLITFIATLFATSAITGLFFLIFPNATADILFYFAIIVLLCPGTFLKVSPQIRYTLLGTGFLLSFSISMITDVILYPYLLLIFLLVGLFIVQMKGMKVLIYILVNMTTAYICYKLFSYDGVPFAMLFLNIIYYMFQKKDIATKRTAFIFSLLFFMLCMEVNLPVWSFIIINIVFFLTLTSMLLVMRNILYRFEWMVSLVFWFIFLIYKYYEYAWDLVHKSILCFILGIIILIYSLYKDKKSGYQQDSSTKLTYKLPLMIVIILMQFGWVSYQTISNEQLLKNGDTITLELEPVDPRSLLQGDYIILHYAINDLDLKIADNDWNKKIKIVLRKNNNKIYSYAGYYYLDNQWNKSYDRRPGDVIINGKMYSPHHIVYGIESYFVKEGTGMELQRNASLATVRVGESGNAILEKVE